MGKKLHRQRRLVSTSAVYLSIFLVFLALSAALLVTGLHRISGPYQPSDPENPVTGPMEDSSGSHPLPEDPASRIMPEGPAPSGAKGLEPLSTPGPRLPATALPPPSSLAPAAPIPESIRPKHKGKLVFILDDAGHNLWQLEPFLALPFPISVAVLPGLPHTKTAASKIVAAGKELLLHQPMEATAGLDPGPGAIYLAMEDHEIRLTIRRNLAQLPGAVGMNNHMGSKATADTRIMAITLDEARRAGVYFLDSFTIAESVVHSVASSMNLRTWERTVFLDNTPDRTSIMKYVSEGTKIAEKRGYAIMIGHVWSAELAQTLSDLYPQLIDQGFSLSTISRIMMDGDDDEDFGN